MRPPSFQEKNGARPKERRNYSRKGHSGSIFFATRKRLFEGELLNYSQAGLGVRVPEKLVAGENLMVALPFDGATPAKRPAKVVWSDGKGFGAKFMR